MGLPAKGKYDMKTLSYPYKPKPWLGLLMFLVFGGGALFMAFDASSNNAGLILNGVEFSPHGATIFYWCLAAACAAFSALGVRVVFMAFGSRRLTLTATELSVPIARRVVVIPLADIKGFDVQAAKKERLLNIYHGKGKLTVLQSFLPDAAAFEELCSAIAGLKPSLRN
jgi:hypothetical protein